MIKVVDDTASENRQERFKSLYRLLVPPWQHPGEIGLAVVLRVNPFAVPITNQGTDLGNNAEQDNEPCITEQRNAILIMVENDKYPHQQHRTAGPWGNGSNPEGPHLVHHELKGNGPAVDNEEGPIHYRLRRLLIVVLIHKYHPSSHSPSLFLAERNRAP